MTKIREKTDCCLNCQEVLEEKYNFCPNCGQENDQKVKSLGKFLKEFFDDLFSLDSRLWRSIPPFLYRPGKLTLAYINGQRSKYITPIRLYLTISVLYFFIASLSVGNLIETEKEKDTIKAEKKAIETQNKKESKKNENKIRFSIFQNEGIINIDKAKKLLANKKMSRQQLMDSLDRENTFFNYMAVKQAVRVSSATDSEMSAYFFGKMPIVMFILLPIFALFLNLFYVFSKRKYYYLEHFIFTLHTHSFVFLMLSLIAIVEILFKEVVIDILGFLLIWAWIYIYIAQKRFYQQNYFWTTVKFIAYSFVYFLILSLGMILSILFLLFIF